MNKPEKTSNFGCGASLNQDIWSFADLILKSRFVKALEEGISRYPIYRELRFAARMNLEVLFDDLALNLGCNVQRISSSQMILDSKGTFISANGGRTMEYCSCSFEIWASSPQLADDMSKLILNRVGDALIKDPMFSIDWHFLTSKGELESASIEELANDILHDAAYPEIKLGVSRFIKQYLEADETVLVIQGPPGTGKTRLIRAILGEISKRKGGKAYALYTGDKKALESDEIFVRFITGWEDAFVVEDADHLLKPRAEGNENLHRFLTIADGVVRAQGRKIIFSTNLPNVQDLDDALIRPGRCFARLNMRKLTREESETLLEHLCDGDNDKFTRTKEMLSTLENNSFSLAEIYKILLS